MMFIDRNDIATLTGYRQKRKQIARLRDMGIAFWINASGFPVVARAALEGGKQPDRVKSWEPSWAGSHR